jgi:hypothetical protein
MIRTALPVVLLLATAVSADAQRRPNIVPPGWTQEQIDVEKKTRQFVSPDGDAFFITRQTRADRSDLRRSMNRIAFKDGEEITYQRRGRSWIAVSGYRGDQIFYRKSNLACGGKVWNHIELLYPRADKRRMDATVTYIAREMTKYSDDCG